MSKFKNYISTLGIMLLIMIISTLVLTFFNYFDIFSKETVSVLKMSLIFITLFIGGIIIGKKSSKKGWLEGLKLGLIFCIILFIINLFLGSFSFKTLFYFFILIVSSIFGSMIGIQKKEI